MLDTRDKYDSDTNVSLSPERSESRIALVLKNTDE